MAPVAKVCGLTILLALPFKRYRGGQYSVEQTLTHCTSTSS